jgi:hypothetical protein
VASNFWSSVVLVRELCQGTPTPLLPCKNTKAHIPDGRRHHGRLSRVSGPTRGARYRYTSCGIEGSPPNSSASKARFNPDKPNLQSFGEFCVESVTPVSWD